MFDVHPYCWLWHASQTVSTASRKKLSALASHGAGAAMVEFALVLPVMLLIYMHMVDFSRAFNERRRVVRLASTLSDLVAQQSTTKAISGDMINSVFSVASAVMTPFPTTDVKMTVSVINLTARADKTCCDAKVKWTSTVGGTLRPCGVALLQVSSRVRPEPDNIVAGMIDPMSVGGGQSAQLVVADVQDTYRPMFSMLNGLFLGGFQKTTYSVPRGVGELILEPSILGAQQQICF